jgi:D-3-phosphoglycerate dehydrogenase
MKPKVLVSKRIYPEAIEYLKQHCEVEYYDSAISYPAEKLLERLKDKDGVVSQLTDKLSEEVLAALPALKVISNVAVGFDNIDIQAATKRGIRVTNTPDVLTDTTADFAFALMISAARRVVEADKYLRAGKWKQWSIDLLCGYDLHHRTIGLFGMGRIGQAMARRARGFDMRILYHDAIRASDAVEKELGLEFASKETILREADFISLHVPLMPETRHLIGKKELQMMKKTAILVNSARGPVVDEAALVEALREGQIAGAGLDVFEREPAVEPGLLELDNAVLAPHIASGSIDTRKKMCMMAAENMVAGLQGKRPPNLVNTKLFEGN